jgi:predicted metalloendopeptidase
MTKTVRNKKNIKNNNKTQKCKIGLKPFVSNYVVKYGKKFKVYSHGKLLDNFVKDLLSKYSPDSIKPQNNFYDHINYLWLKNVTVSDAQKYITQVDDFRLIQDKVYNELDGIILDYIKNNKNKLATNLTNFYDSVIKMNSIDDSKKLSKEAVLLIDNYIEKDNLWDLLAFFNSDEMLAPSAPFYWSINPDDKNPEINRCYISPHKFFMLDIEIYYNDGKDEKYKNKYRDSYKQTVQTVINTCLGKGSGLKSSDVFDVEVDIFNALGCIDITSKEESYYNKILSSESLNKYGFDWHEFSKCLGFKKTPHFFITSSTNYLKCGSDLLINNWKTPKWRTYWIYLLLRRIVRITKKWENIIFSFHGKFERGQEQINKSDAVSASLYMSIPFNTFLTNQYMEKYYDPQKNEYVSILSQDLLLTFKGILEKNTWLSPKTKKYALHKLNKFKFIIGKPDKLREDPDLDYTKNLYDNLKKILTWRHEKFIELEGKSVIDIPVMDWTQYPAKMTGTQAYIVNASYTPSKNAIYINQGYIQKPFVDLDERGIEYNLAHIGFTLSHEMSHGFDDWGSKYDADGKLNDWWTESDKRKFKSIKADIIKQYEDFAAKDGIKFDASIGVGEDMADISGMAICDTYLRHFQLNNNDIIPIRNLSFQAFYTYFALHQRQFIAKKALSAQLKTNPHPLDKYRCNIPLSRSRVFRALFDVKKGDGMWWHNTDIVW